MATEVLPMPDEGAVAPRVGDARRARFRDAIAAVADRAQSAELVRLLLLPGLVALVLGFGVMLLGWWGAARTHREIEQIPYLISGGLIGLGLVIVGALLVASAMWMTVLQRHEADLAARVQQEVAASEARLRDELATRSRPNRRSR
jgi:hypothetical protein